jgi:hypothetical protein
MPSYGQFGVCFSTAFHVGRNERTWFVLKNVGGVALKDQGLPALGLEVGSLDT